MTPKDWRATGWEGDVAFLDVVCGRCGATFRPVVPMVEDVTVKCGVCGASNRIEKTGFSDITFHGWQPA